MSQPPLQHPPRPYSPWQQAQSPDGFLPPAKRQRIDSAPSSPYSQSPQLPYAPSPNYANIALPNGYNPQRQTNGVPQMPPPAVQQRTNFGVMGPPQRPVERSSQTQEDKPERHLDINDLSDLVTSSGIDIREEENYLAASYRSDRNNASFNSQSTQATSPHNSFDLLSQNSFGAIGSQRASDVFTQTPSRTQEQELYDKHKKAARTVNESQQHHLDHPFLLGNGTRKRMERIANESGVRLPLEGLFDRVADRPQSVSGSSINGIDGSSLVEAHAPSLLNRQTALEPLLALLSLAANDRLRGLLEDAYGLARGRQYGSDGVVPTEWSDLAVNNGAEAITATAQSISGTPWEEADATADVGLDEKQALPSPPISDPDSSKQPAQPHPTLAFPKSSSITQGLTSMARRDREAEEARLKLRTARAAKKAAQAAAAATTTPDSSGAGGGSVTPTEGSKTKLPPGMLGERAPEVKATKKELARQAKQDMSDEVATRNANSTASMQLGNLGKSYSWMNSGGKAGAKASTPVGRPLGGKAGAGSGGIGGGGTGGARGKHHIDGWPMKDRKFGEWREDGSDGKGIQLRDWIGVLEIDGRERKSLGWAFARAGGVLPPAQTPGVSPATAQTPGGSGASLGQGPTQS